MAHSREDPFQTSPFAGLENMRRRSAKRENLVRLVIALLMLAGGALVALFLYAAVWLILQAADFAAGEVRAHVDDTVGRPSSR